MSCIALAIAVVGFINLGEASDRKIEETHEYQFCEQGVDLNMVPSAVGGPSLCDLAADRYVHLLRMAGELPGSPSRSLYAYSCSTGI